MAFKHPHRGIFLAGGGKEHPLDKRCHKEKTVDKTRILSDLPEERYGHMGKIRKGERNVKLGGKRGQLLGTMGRAEPIL